MFGVVLALAGLLGATSVVAAPPAAAAIAAPTAKIAFGDRSLTLAWGAVKGATGYSVQYSTSSSMAGAVTKSAGTATSLFVTGLTNDVRYYARVVAVAGTSKAVGTTLSATPDSGYPRQLTVTAVPAGLHKIKVTWTGQGRATKVGVIAGSEGSITQDYFRSGWLPATTTSLTFTVPASLRSKLGSGTGNPVFMKVVTYNSLTAGTGMPTVKDEAKAYRLSLAGTYTQPSPITPTGARLRVAEWNVNSVAATSTAAFKGYTWKDRRTKVAAGIAASRAALVATAELTTADAGNGKTQWEDLRDLLAQDQYGGYGIANTLTSATRNGATNTTVGAHLFYDPDVLTVLDGDFVSPRTLMGKDWPAGLVDRYFSWAHLRVKATGADFYAVALHLPANSGSTSYAALRVKEAAAVDTYMTKLAGSRPVLVMGDFNSSAAETANGPDGVLVGRGYYDASAAPTRSNARTSTANITRQVDNLKVPGYPTRPYVYQYPAPRIDYIMIKNAPGSWRYSNHLLLTDGAFTPAYHGSDHNLQWAEIGIPGGS